MTCQIGEFARIRNHIEGTQSEGAPLHGNRFDAVRVDDASPGPHEIETPLELGTAGEGKDAIQSVGREQPESIRGCGTPRVDHTMSAERSDET